MFLNVSTWQSGHGSPGRRKRILYFLAKRLKFFRLFSAIRDREAVLKRKTVVGAKNSNGITVQNVLGEGEFLLLYTCVSWCIAGVSKLAPRLFLGDSSRPKIGWEESGLI